MQQALQNIEVNKKVTVNNDLQDISNINIGFQNKKSEQAKIKINAKGQIIGKCCTQNTQNATRELINLVLQEIYDIPIQDRESLSMNLEITGHADWQGAGKNLNIHYAALRDINEIYTNQNQEANNFILSKGQKKQITNEQLAFLRAYCAYATALEILENQELKANTLNFKTIEHFEKDDADGSAFRGVELQIYINGLDEYYKRLREEEEQKIKLSNNRILELENQIQVYEKNISIIEKIIQLKNLEIDFILLKIEQAEYKITNLKNVQKRYSTKAGTHSQANHIIETIKDDIARYKTKQK
ncbi:MAG: hypothetical protein ACPG5B_14145 [Chitinophagales bacterium]